MGVLVFGTSDCQSVHFLVRHMVVPAHLSSYLVRYSINAYPAEIRTADLVRALTGRMIETIIRQDSAFFEDPSNCVGELTVAVTFHPATIGVATGIVFAQILISVSAILG